MIKSEKEYTAIVERIEELLSNPENIENPEAKGFVELNLLSDLVADFEEKQYPILPPIIQRGKDKANEFSKEFKNDRIFDDPVIKERLAKSIQSYKEGKTNKLTDEQLKKLLDK